MDEGSIDSSFSSGTQHILLVYFCHTELNFTFKSLSLSLSITQIMKDKQIWGLSAVTLLCCHWWIRPSSFRVYIMTWKEKCWAARTRPESLRDKLLRLWCHLDKVPHHIQSHSGVTLQTELGDAQGIQVSSRGLLLSAANAAALRPYFMSPFLHTEGIFCIIPQKPLSTGNPRRLSEEACFKPQLCSPSASGLSPHNPSITGSAKCSWRRRQKSSCTAAHWLKPL